jgi:hypothetical protein
MDSMRGFDRDEDGGPVLDDAAVEAPPAIGTDERRMHVRAYNYWVSLLAGRPYPSIEDLEPTSIQDFGSHSVLLDFTSGVDNPAIAWLGRDLREECGVAHDIKSISEVPSRSLLSRLTDHYLQIIANRAPIGFEAEFVSSRGRNTMYRGILMPFSSDEDSIDFIYGVINWKEVVEEATAGDLEVEVGQALRDTPRQIAHAGVPVWADGPNAEPMIGEPLDYDYESDPVSLGDDAELYDWLAAARESADAAQQSEGRSRAALYAALGRAHDFALATLSDPAGYAEMLEDAGVAAQARAPMTPIVKLVFGVAYDKTRLTEYAAVLSYAQRQEVPVGGLVAMIEAHEGGVKGIVLAERRLRAPAAKPKGHAPEVARAKLRTMAAKATVDLDTGDSEFVLLVARRESAGTLSVIAPITDDQSLIDRAIRVATA